MTPAPTISSSASASSSKRCLARLAEAIAQADRWYARREAELAAFDRRARSTVDRLRAEHRVNASMAWHPV